MTKLAKIAVLVNLALSLVFASWALLTYSQRVDWTNKKKDANDERSWGRLARVNDEIERLNGKADKAGPRGAAEARAETALRALRFAENVRVANQAWYREQLTALETGKTAQGQAAPVTLPVYQKGQLQFDKGRPVLEVVNDKAGKAVPSRPALTAEQAALHKDIEADLVKIKGLVAEADKLTVELKQLFTQIERTAQEKQNALEEQKYLEHVLYNVQVEAQVLRERQKALEARLKELAGVRVTSQR